MAAKVAPGSPILRARGCSRLRAAGQGRNPSRPTCLATPSRRAQGRVYQSGRAEISPDVQLYAHDQEVLGTGEFSLEYPRRCLPTPARRLGGCPDRLVLANYDSSITLLLPGPFDVRVRTQRVPGARPLSTLMRRNVALQCGVRCTLGLPVFMQSALSHPHQCVQACPGARL